MNTTEIELDTYSVIQQLAKRYTEREFVHLAFIEKKYLSVAFINDWGISITKSHKNSLIKNLKKRRLIDSDDPKKTQLNNLRQYCFNMSDLSHFCSSIILNRSWRISIFVKDELTIHSD